MLARVDPREQDARTALRAWSSRARTYAKTNIKQMVIFGGVGFAVGWVLNIWIMASHYDGFRTPTGSPATGTGNFFQGTLFYFFASALISSTISYRLLVGSERFWREIYGVPSSIKQAFTSDGDSTLVHLLVGFASAMLIVMIVGPSLAGALAFGALLAFTPVLRPLVTGVLLTVYRWLVGRVAPKRTTMPPTVSMLVGVTGSIAAFGIGGVLPTSSSFVVGLVAVVAAIIVAQRNKPSTSAILLALGAGVLAYWFADAAIALADDGGMAECGNPGWGDWWSNCGGASTVRDRALIGATGASAGAITGAALGGSATGTEDGGGNGPYDGDGPRGGPNGRGPEDRDRDGTVVDDDFVGPRGPGDERADERREGEEELTPVGGGSGGGKPKEFDLDKIKLEDINWELMPVEMRERIRQQLIHEWREKNPGADYIRQQEAGQEIDAMVSGEGPIHQWMSDAWEFTVDTAVFTWQDFKDGSALMSIEGAVEGIYEGLKTGAIGIYDMVTHAPEMLGVAVDFWVSQNPAASIEQIMDEIPGMTRDMANQFLTAMNELEAAALRGDNEGVGRMIGVIAGQAEFEVLMGAGSAKAVAVGREAAAGTRIGIAIEKAETFIRTPRGRGGVGDDAVGGLQRQANDINVDTNIDPALLRRRAELMDKARQGDGVRLTIDEADELFAIDRRITDNRQGTILQTSEGSAADGMSTTYKLGDENGLAAKRLRTEHPDIWTGKWNPVNDKGFKPGEELFMSADDLKRFETNPLQPGETINYKPRQLSPDEIADLPPALKDQYFARQKDAAGWDNNTGFDSRREVDYSDPNVRDRYGDMWVAEDTANPVQKAEFWKDPNDNRVYVRYQTQDGNWSTPRRQASDVDTVTHSGGTNVSYETSRDMQYNQSFGQLGEGDTANWGMDFLEPDGAGGYMIRDARDQDMVFKAIDALKRADGELVLKQDLDGLLLTKAEFPELEHLANAAKKANWSPEQAASLREWGIIP